MASSSSADWDTMRSEFKLHTANTLIIIPTESSEREREREGGRERERERERERDVAGAVGCTNSLRLQRA